MKMVLFLLLIVIAIITTNGQLIYSSNNNYVYIQQQYNFFRANRFCEDNFDTTLAIIHDDTENIEAYNVCDNADCWIGLQNIFVQESASWLDESPLTYIPSSSTLNSTFFGCAMMNQGSPAWSATLCDNEFEFLCIAPLNTKVPTSPTNNPTQTPSLIPSNTPTIIPTPSPTQPQGYGHNIFFSLNEKYILVEQTLDWWSAQKMCELYFGSQLAIIENDDDNFEASTLCINFVKNSGFQTSANCWIGLTDLYGPYEWENDKQSRGLGPNQLTKYWSDDYNIANGECAYFENNTTKWNVGDCSTCPCNIVLCDAPLPTVEPTTMPTVVPTNPTNPPTNDPTLAPSKMPSTSPTKNPTSTPTAPTKSPTNIPSKTPTNEPTATPTDPSNQPTQTPTKPPSGTPTKQPTKQPTPRPSDQPTKSPTPAPTDSPTDAPSPAPTPPTSRPTRAPTDSPTDSPTSAPTNPTSAPTKYPTRMPTQPTESPTDYPTRAPTLPCSYIGYGDTCEYNDVNPDKDSVSEHINEIDISSSSYLESYSEIYSYWTITGNSACFNPEVQIRTEDKGFYYSDQYLNIFEIGDTDYGERYSRFLGRCEDTAYGNCGEYITCLDADSYYSSYSIDTIQIGETYGIQIIPYDEDDIDYICSSYLNIDAILICNGEPEPAFDAAVVSIIFFVLCLLYMIPVCIWSTLYFFAKKGTFQTLKRRKPGDWGSIWRGSDRSQKAALIADPVDIITDFFGCITIMGSAPTKPNPGLWRFCGGWSIFSFIFGAIFFMFKLKVLRRLMPCIEKWNKIIKAESKEMEELKEKQKFDTTGKIEADRVNKWTKLKRKSSQKTKYLGHIIMFNLFTAAVEDSIQCTVLFRLQWSVLLEDTDGLSLFIGYLWFKVIMALLMMVWKISNALSMQLCRCHQDKLDPRIKPDNVDTDSDDEPLTAKTIFFGKRGLIPGGSGPILDAGIIAAAKNFVATGKFEDDRPAKPANVGGDSDNDNDDSDYSRTSTEPLEIEDTHYHIDLDGQLPFGWRKCVTSDGKTYFQNDATKQTQWEHPVTNVNDNNNNLTVNDDNKEDELPNGWRKSYTSDGKVYYQNDITKKTQWSHPLMKNDQVLYKDASHDPETEAILDDLVDEQMESTISNTGIYDGVDSDDEESSETFDSEERNFFDTLNSFADTENAKNVLNDDDDEDDDNKHDDDYFAEKYQEEWKKNVMELIQEKSKLLKNLTLKNMALNYVSTIFNGKNGYEKSVETLKALNTQKNQQNISLDNNGYNQYTKLEMEDMNSNKINDINQRNDNEAP